MKIGTYNNLPKSNNINFKNSSISKKIIFGTLVILLVFEVFSGALRYYLSIWGIVSFYYVPKILCLLLIFWKLFSLQVKSIFPVIIIIAFSFLAMYHGASYFNVGFSIFLYTPLFFGVIFGNDFDANGENFIKLLWWCYVLSVIGILLDFFTTVPWKGFNYLVGDVEVVGNRQWSAFGKDRIAGFARVSSALALMLVSLAVYLDEFNKSRIKKLCLVLITVTCIFLTTNKTTLPAYFIGLLIVWFRSSNLKPILFLIILIGILLPFVSVLFEYNFIEEISNTQNTELTFSLDDRIVNTWPNFFNNTIAQGGPLFGLGFGATGGSVILFPISAYKKLKGSLGGADNTALYLWGMLGVVGILLYYQFFWVMTKLQAFKRTYTSALLGTVSCICVVSWTTDVLETTSGCLFIGIAISIALRKYRGH